MTCPILDAGPASLDRAADAVSGGDLIILPTDTVYGVTADIRRDVAVARINTAKGRPGVPLQLLFGPDAALIGHYAALDASSRRVIEQLGPGGWTLIVPAREGWMSPALAGGTTVGIRIPDAPVVHEIVERLGAPLAASSANRHGDASPVTCADAVASIGDACALAIDAGPCAAALDSTIIDLASQPPVILREGAIDRETIAAMLGMNAIEVRRSVRVQDRNNAP